MKVVFERPTATRVPAAGVWPDSATVAVAMQYRHSRVGGDFFDAFLVGDDYLFFILIDIAGKGAQALPVAASVQEMIRSEVPAGLDESGNRNEQMAEIAMRINRTIMTEAGGIKNSPGFLGLLNHKLGLLSYCNAGHLPGLVKEGQDVTFLSSGGIPLGLFGHYAPETRVFAIQPDSVLMLASKGVIHSRRGREEFGADRLADFLSSNSFPSARQWCTEALGEVERFEQEATRFGPQFRFFGMGKRGQGQDSTIVALIRKVGSVVLAA